MNDFPVVLEHEYNDDVLEYYDKHGPVNSVIAHKKEEGSYLITGPLTNFVIAKQGAGFEECKTEKELLKLEREKPPFVQTR